MTRYSPSGFLKKLFPFNTSDLVYVSERLHELEIDIDDFKDMFYENIADGIDDYKLQNIFLWFISSVIEEEYKEYFLLEKTVEEVKEIMKTYNEIFPEDYGYEDIEYRKDYLKRELEPYNILTEALFVEQDEDGPFYTHESFIEAYHSNMVKSYNKIPIEERSPILLWFWDRYMYDIKKQIQGIGKN